MDLESRAGYLLERHAPQIAYRACILLNDAALENPAGFPAQEAVKERAKIHDAFVKQWFKRIVKKTFGEEVSHDIEEPPFEYALLATGGYGRYELNPSSDIDLKLVIDEPALQGNALVQTATNEAVYTFKQEYGFPLELSCHTLQDLGELTEAGLNTFLDMRHIGGEHKLVQRIRDQLNLRYDPADLFLHNLQAHAKLAKNHGSLDDFSKFDIKNGAGGLRVFHIARYLDSLPTSVLNQEEMIEEGPFSITAQERRKKIPEHIERAFAVLLTTRSWLNSKKERESKEGKEKDILSRDDFEELSTGMRQAVASARHTIASYFEQTRRKKLETGLQVPRGEYSFSMTTEGLKQVELPNSNQRDKNERIYRLLHLAQERQIPLHPTVLEKLVTMVPSSLFIEGLRMEQPFLEIAKALHTTGAFSRIIPGFETLYGQLIGDSKTGIYTAAGRAIQRLEALEKISEERELTADERATLRFATLITDIPQNKTMKTGNQLLEYPGVDSEKGRDLLFLLSRRKILIEKALGRLSDEGTVRELSTICEDARRVELLELYTKADLKGVRDVPEYIFRNMDELVRKVKMKMRGQETIPIRKGMLSEDGEAIYDDLGPDFHSSRYAEKQLATWISLLERVQKTEKPLVKPFNMDWPLFGIAAQNRKGLLAALTGTFYREGVNVRQAHAYTLSRAGLVLDFFETAKLTEEREEKLKYELTQVASGEIVEIPERQTILQKVQGNAIITKQEQAGYYVLEYKAKQDAPGILYALTDILTRNMSASIWGMNAHVRGDNTVEDRVFFTVPEETHGEELERIFKIAIENK